VKHIPVSFDLRALPRDFYDDPFPYYAALREAAPVKRMPDGSILLTRHRDIEYVYKNPKLFSSDKRLEFKLKFGDSPLFAHHTTSLVFNDPPLHSRVRRLIAGPLTPKAISAIEPDLTVLIDRLLDRLQARGRGDLIEDFAAAIPIEVIGNLRYSVRWSRTSVRRQPRAATPPSPSFQIIWKD
jgi:cytochrome P450